MSWDERYSKGDHANLEPMPFLAALAEKTPVGSRVADLACGAGRHALLFAAQGCQVTAVDSSPVALDLIRSRNSAVECIAADLETFDLGIAQWDLIIVTMYLQRSLFAAMRRAVKPGGAVALAIPLVDTREGVRPMNPAYLLGPGELAWEFCEPEWIAEHDAERYPDPPGRGIAERIARKV